MTDSDAPLRVKARRDCVTLEIPGRPRMLIDPDHLPAVGTTIQVHKHLVDGGTTLLLQITGQEWLLNDDTVDEYEKPQTPTFTVNLKTKLVNP